MYEDELSEVFRLAERKLGKMLSSNDMESLKYIHGDLCLPLEVIAILFDYALSKGIRTVRYIAKVAIDWEERGINTVEKARAIIGRLMGGQGGRVGNPSTASGPPPFNKGGLRKNKFNNYTDTNAIDYRAHEEEVLRAMLEE